MAAAAMVVGLLVPLMSVGIASAYTFPSTNDENRTNGHPHVNLLSTDVGEVTLEFVNNTNSLAYFEVRVDGELPTGNSHPVVGGNIYTENSVCVDNRAIPHQDCIAGSEAQVTFSADEKVEVRLALGGERDWDFDWVTFYVDQLVIEPSVKMCVSYYTGKVVTPARNGPCPSGYADIFQYERDEYKFCENTYTGALEYRIWGNCGAGRTEHVIPDDGDLLTCVSRYTGHNRAVGSHAQCRSSETPGGVFVSVLVVN